mmetsp:Transcript_27892/g.31245  ORF Transcript_27892/g.31245 Transcript_27892/m.31245 type:complete len:117 (+) Transcript_27892:1-351(+)
MKNETIEVVPFSSVKSEDIPYSCGSSGMVIRSSIDNAIHVKKEEGIADNGNQNANDSGKGSDDDAGTRRTIRDGLFRVQPNVQPQQQIKKRREAGRRTTRHKTQCIILREHKYYQS